MSNKIEYVKKRNGRLVEYQPDKINKTASRSCQGLANVSPSELVLDAVFQLQDKTPTSEIDKALIQSARDKIHKEPNYSYVAARLVNSMIYRDVFGDNVNAPTFNQDYRASFRSGIRKAIKEGLLTEKMEQLFDLNALSNYLTIERDNKFKFLGISILSQRYLLRHKKVILETPQGFWMRVAMGLALNEQDPTARAIEFYDLFSLMLYTPSTPTLFNSGSKRSQLSSCYLNTFEDSIDGIFEGIWQEARKSKFAGGLGFDVTPWRAIGASIDGTPSICNGSIPWLKVINDMLVAVNQKGKRPGAGCAYMEPWHKDFDRFIDLRRNTGDDRARTHDLNIACWTNDLLIKRTRSNGPWYMFCPNDAPDLHSLYGQAFEDRYQHYCDMADQGKITNFKVMPARDLWKLMISSLFETSHPWITFKDPCNERYSNKHVGVVNSSNLCCIAGDQLVACDKGLVPVRELYDLQCTNAVVGREFVESAGPMLLPRPNAPIVRIHTHQGYSHKVTPDHKVWIKDVGWKQAQDLEVDDDILIQQFEGMYGQAENSDLALIAGMIIGDGNITRLTANIDVWEKDFHICAELEQKVAKVIEKYSYLHTTTSPVQATTTPTFKDCSKSHCSVSKKRLQSPYLKSILEHFGIIRGNKHKVPDFVLKGTKATVGQFLRGLFICDCTLTGNEAKKISTVALTSTSLSMLETIQIVLSNCGIKSQIWKGDKRTSSILPDGLGGKKQYNTKRLYRLHITGAEGCLMFEYLTNVNKHKKNEEFDSCIRKGGYSQKKWATFSHLEQCVNEDAYCLQVNSEEHSWTVNGLVTKNTEITLHTEASKFDRETGEKISVGETAVCNLGSINLYSHLINVDGLLQIDKATLANTIRVARRILDNVIDLNFYPTAEARNSNMKHRPVGLGIMGLQDMMHALNIVIDSSAAIEFNNSLFEFISAHSILAGAELAKERGPYQTYQGSLWSQGLMPHDTYAQYMKQYRPDTILSAAIAQGETEPELWKQVREAVATHGVRNSMCMAIAPTATISDINGVEQSIEPAPSVCFVKENYSGNFLTINEHFVLDMKREGLWTPQLIQQMVSSDGDLTQIDIPPHYKRKYANLRNRDMFMLIKCNAARQKWIDQAISFNIAYFGTSSKELSDIYFAAWDQGLKTTYYLRSEAATKIEKAASGSQTRIDGGESACSLEARRRGEICESCS